MKALQNHLPFLPENIEIISDKLGVVRDDRQLVFYNAAGPIYTCGTDDKEGIRIAQGIFTDLNIAKPRQIARVLGVHKSTVYRNKKKYQEGGVTAFKKDPEERGPYKLKEEKLREVQENLDKNVSIRKTSEQVEISEGAIRNSLKKGLLDKKDTDRDGKNPSVRSAEDQRSDSGIGVKRHGERTLARIGLLEEAGPRFEVSESVPNAGVLLALPFLLSQGLLEVGKKVYGGLKKGFFGLRSILLTLAFMALLRIKTPEQLTDHSPGELGCITK